MTMLNIHGQTPTAILTEIDYNTLLLHLGEQLTGVIRKRGDQMSEGEAAEEAYTALKKTFRTSEDQTVLDWIKAAAAEACVSHEEMVGI